MDIRELHARNVAEANARLAAEGRCVFHNSDVHVPARYLVALPIGNVVPLCAECCAYIRKDAADNPEDQWAQPVQITEIRPC